MEGDFVPQPGSNPIDAIRAKLALLLQRGKKAGPDTTAPVPGNTPANPDTNYPRDPVTGLLKRGATEAGAVSPQPATTQPATDATPEQKPAAPTITPVTPGGTSAAPGGATPPTQKPFLTDEQWARQNPGAVPSLTPYKAPGKMSTLAHALAFGAMGFGNAQAGERAATEWIGNIEKQKKDADTAARNYPQTIHQARQKADVDQAALEHTQAETHNLESQVQQRGQPVQTPRERLEADYIKQTQAHDPQASVTHDILARLYPKDFKDEDIAEMAKIPPQVIAQSGPKPITPSYGAPGQPPKLYASTQEAQAAWGAHVQELQKPAPSETNKLDPLIESQIGPQPKRESFQQGHIGDVAFAAANKAWGIAGEAIKLKEKESERVDPSAHLSATERVQVERETRTAVRKADLDYRNAEATANLQRQFIQEAKSGNKEAVKIVPLQGALEITTSQGVHRINRTEVEQYGTAGSWYDRIVGAIGKGVSGKDIPNNVLDDMDKMTQAIHQNAYKKYNDTYEDEMGIAGGYGLDLRKKLPKVQGPAAAPAHQEQGQKPAKWNGKEWVDGTTGKSLTAGK